MGFLKDLLRSAKSKAAVDYAHAYIETGEPTFVAPDTQYLRVWLRAARIVDVRRWTKKFYGAVHARFSFPDRATGTREVMSVVAPGKSFEELDPKNLDRLIIVNQPLLGPIPYRGELEMEVALFSVESADLAKPYLELLSDLTNTATVSFLSQLKPFVGPISKGAELLFGGPGVELETGLDRNDAQLRTGNIVVARVPKNKVSIAQLRLDPNDYRLVDAVGNPVEGFPYIVLGIEATAERADYARIPEVHTGWEAVRRAASEGSVEDVRQRFEQLRRAILLCNDLVQSDKKRIVAIFGREVSDAGYDVAPPLEAATAESASVTRPLRDAAGLLESGVSERAALESAGGSDDGRISMDELQRMMRDPDVPDAVLREYFTVNPEETRPFAPAVIPDPERVAVAPPVDGLEGAMMMGWANGLCRLRRQAKFGRRRRTGDRRPVLVSEGDSWFQFPLFLEDVIDNLFRSYNVWSVDAAGDTLQNMIVTNSEYMRALRENAKDVRAFLFSGGGNDIIGEDEAGNPIIASLLKAFEPGRPAEWYLDTEALAEKLRFVEQCYRTVILNVSAEFPGLPVICHGYDYAIPGGAPDDVRNPLWAKRDQWIGRAMREELKITEPTLQRAVVRAMIDRFNERVRSLCGGNNPNGAYRNAWHVDVRGTVGSFWADELHPTNDGYSLVARRFLSVIRAAIPSGLEAAEDEPPSPNAGDDSDVAVAERAPEWQLPALESAAMPWRVAKALLHLRRQVNAKFPNRLKNSDGTIGDAAHASRTSDHNPWVVAGDMDVVTAMDITHDPGNGCDGELLAQALHRSRDRRIKYLIWNKRICSSSAVAGTAPWDWRAYTGRNTHEHHVHISVLPDPEAYDGEQDWTV